MVQIGVNRYGKAEIRVVRVARGAAPDGGDVIRDWNVSTPSPATWTTRT